MKRPRSVRCYRAFTPAAGQFKRDVVFLANQEGKAELVTCLACGEVYLVDFGSPATAGLYLGEVVARERCSHCGRPLAETVRAYPQNFLAAGGGVGSFLPPKTLPPESESEVRALLEIVPEGTQHGTSYG